MGKTGNQKIAVWDKTKNEPVLLDGRPVLDPLTNLPFVDEGGNSLTDPRTGQPYKVDPDTGCVTIPAYDCNGPCTIKCGWYCQGRFKDVPLDCHDYMGCYRNTYVWVEPQYRHELAKLVLAILDYAEKDPPSKPTKDVTLLVNRRGEIASSPLDAIGIVQSTITIGDANERILRVDPLPCEKPPASAGEINKGRTVDTQLNSTESRTADKERAEWIEARQRLQDLAPLAPTQSPSAESATGASALYERMLLDALAPSTR
ncbi:hypothetical protein [Caulifigura coniformis]|uniref:hypothetical protein n=1 Tax=Caulifigura coniformis TaxID=2527983 RepID=UPI0011A27D4D|nr:hypothetical protein [Caulifigura coniformis]